MDEFHCRTRVISGAGTIEKLGKLGARRVFLVTDPYFYENGTANRVAAATGAEQVEIFHDVKPDPTVELAAEGTARLRAFDPAAEIVALIERDNAPSIALFRKLGFMEECWAESIRSYVYTLYGTGTPQGQ